ncbi:MAG: T9SS type A sorting domain-containing protein [Cytophagales bacterium]|nr:T9SS type A sorting domain-containing protein [Cytophagales bacterium]
MKNYLPYSFLLISCIVSQLCCSQIVFNQKYNTNNSPSRANSVIQTTDSSYIVVGTTSNALEMYILKVNSIGDTLWSIVYDLGIGGGDIIYNGLQVDDENILVGGVTADISQMKSDAFLIKLDNYGNKIWEQKYGLFTNSEGCYDIKQNQDQGFIFVGWRYNIDSSGNSTDSDVYLVKTDSSGIMQWEQIYGGVDYDLIRSIDFTSDRGYILGGTTFSFGLGPYDLYLIKTDSAGNFQWQKTFGDSMRDYGNSVVTTNDGGYVLVGASEVSTDNYEAYIVKTDSTGNIEWERTFGKGPEYDEFTKVKILPDGSYIACGNTLDYSGTRNKPVGFIMKISPSGDSLWSRTYDYYTSDSTDHYFYGMDLTYDGGFVMCGMVINNKTVTKNDVWLVKTDCMGYDTITPSAQAGFTYNLDTIIAGFTFTNLSQYATEYLWYFGDGDSSTAVNPTHIYPDTGKYVVTLIAKGCEEVEKDTVTDTITVILTGTLSQTSYGVLMKIYPNPANQSITILYDLPANTKKCFISLYNFIGRKVKDYPANQKQNSLTIRINDIETGVYFMQLAADGVIVAREKIVIVK